VAEDRQWRLIQVAAKVLLFVAVVGAGLYRILPDLLDKPDPNVGALAEPGCRMGMPPYRASTRGRAVWLWKRNREEPFILRERPGEVVRALALSNDASVLATAVGGRIKLWDVGKRRVRHSVSGAVKRVDVLVFTAAPDWLVAFGEADGKLDVWHVPSGRLRATVAVPREKAAADAFRLELRFPKGKPAAKPRLSRTEYESVRDANSVGALLNDGEGGPWRLRDNVSGQFVQSCNDGWTDPNAAEPAKSLSWHAGGRYSAYAGPHGVLIWKLCPRRDAQRVTEGGRIFLR